MSNGLNYCAKVGDAGHLCGRKQCTGLWTYVQRSPSADISRDAFSPGRMTQGHTLVCGSAATTHSQFRLPKKRRRGRSEQSPRVQCTDSYAKATVKKNSLLSLFFLCNNISLVQGPSGQRPSNWGLWLHGASEFIIENVFGKPRNWYSVVFYIDLDL